MAILWTKTAGWRASAGVASIAVTLSVVTVSATARTFHEPAYKDDRSTPTAVIESLYNAINRHEIVRAYSYWQGSPNIVPFDTFEKGYSQTVRTHLHTGKVTSEGAAGSIYYMVPVAVRTVNKDGSTIVFAGCYTLRLADPSIQAEPPFQPMHIVSGKLLRAKGRTSKAVPDHCGD